MPQESRFQASQQEGDPSKTEDSIASMNIEGDHVQATLDDAPSVHSEEDEGIGDDEHEVDTLYPEGSKITTTQAILVSGKLAVAIGTQGSVLVPSPAALKEGTISVRFEKRADGQDKPIRVYPHEIVEAMPDLVEGDSECEEDDQFDVAKVPQKSASEQIAELIMRDEEVSGPQECCRQEEVDSFEVISHGVQMETDGLGFHVSLANEELVSSFTTHISKAPASENAQAHSITESLPNMESSGQDFFDFFSRASSKTSSISHGVSGQNFYSMSRTSSSSSFLGAPRLGKSPAVAQLAKKLHGGTGYSAGHFNFNGPAAPPSDDKAIGGGTPSVIGKGIAEEFVEASEIFARKEIFRQAELTGSSFYQQRSGSTSLPSLSRTTSSLGETMFSKRNRLKAGGTSSLTYLPGVVSKTPGTTSIEAVKMERRLLADLTRAPSMATLPKLVRMPKKPWVNRPRKAYRPFDGASIMRGHEPKTMPTLNEEHWKDLPDGDSDDNPFESMDGSDGETLEHQTSPGGSAKSPASGASPKSRALAASPRRSVASVKEKPLEPSARLKSKVMRTKNVRAQKGLPRPDARGPPAKASVHARMSSILA
jgi:hypothetical protein